MPAEARSEPAAMQLLKPLARPTARVADHSVWAPAGPGGAGASTSKCKVAVFAPQPLIGPTGRVPSTAATGSPVGPDRDAELAVDELVNAAPPHRAHGDLGQARQADQPPAADRPLGPSSTSSRAARAPARPARHPAPPDDIQNLGQPVKTNSSSHRPDSNRPGRPRGAYAIPISAWPNEPGQPIKGVAVDHNNTMPRNPHNRNSAQNTYIELNRNYR